MKCEAEHQQLCHGGGLCLLHFSPSGLGVVNREVRDQSHVQFPWKLIDGPLDLALLHSALLNHQLDVFIIQHTDEVTFQVTVV